MKLHRLIKLSLGVLLFASCSSEESLVQNQNNSSDNTSVDYKVSEEMAVRLARKAVADCGAPVTRQYASAHVSAIRSQIKTRSVNLPDTLLYVVNFENDGGFAVVGADMRAMPVYAVSDSGQLGLSEDSPEALKLIMEGIELDAAEKIANDESPNFERGLGGAAVDPWAGWQEFFIGSETAGPHISHFQSRTSYTGDYSKYIVNSNGNMTQSGCVAVAAEILMSFYKCPQTIYYQSPGSNFFKRYTFDWDYIDETENIDAIARFLSIIGAKDYLALLYGENPTDVAHGSTYKISDVLEKFGYTSGGHFLSFLINESVAQEVLKTDPIVMNAYEYVDNKIKSGHAWIIDGWKIYKWYTLVRDPENPHYDVRDDYNGYMYHCVWGGTNGSSNGYYYIKNVNGANGFFYEPDELGPDDNTDTSWSVNNYHNYDIQFLNGVKR